MALTVANVQHSTYGAVGDGVTDDNHAIQLAINAVATQGAGVVYFPNAAYKVGNLTLAAGLRLVGGGLDRSGSLGTRLIGTTGTDMMSLPTTGNYGGFTMEHMKLIGGRNQLVLSGNDESSTYVNIRDCVFGSATEAGILINGGAIEEWYLDHVSFSGGQYGFKKVSSGDLDNLNNYIDKSTFKDCIFGGQTKTGFWADTTLANVVTFINPIFNLTGEHAFYWRGGSRGVTIINPNTEQCGTSGKNNRTTLSGTVSSGATSGTLASATGWATGDQITIMGAGAAGTDLVDTVTISGTTATWSTATSTTVASPKVTNAKWDEFHFETIAGVAGPAHVTFLGGIVASEASLGKLRYSIRVPGDIVTLLGVAGGTSNDVPAYSSGRYVVALGGNLLVRSAGREWDTSANSLLPPQIISSSTTSGVPLTLTGLPSQSGNLTQWTNSAGSVLSKVDSLGRIMVGSSAEFFLDSVNKKLTVDASTGSAGTDRMDIKLAPSETRRALRVLDSAGAELFTIGPTGSLFFGDPATAVSITKGSGSPEGVITAPIGSSYHRTDGGAGTSLYQKESGSGNTGWVGK